MFFKTCDNNYGIYRNLTVVDLGVLRKSGFVFSDNKSDKKSLGSRYLFNFNMKLNRFKKRAAKKGYAKIMCSQKFSILSQIKVYNSALSLFCLL